MTKIPVTLDADGIALVTHDLATTDVRVTCLTGDGTAVGYVLASSVDTGTVEVVTVPGTGVTHVLIENSQ